MNHIEDNVFNTIKTNVSTKVLFDEIINRLAMLEKIEAETIGSNGNGKIKTKRAYKKKVKRKTLDANDLQLIANLLAEGWTQTQVAKRIGCSPAAIYGRIRQTDGVGLPQPTKAKRT